MSTLMSDHEVDVVPAFVAAARTAHASKIYGKGDTEVRALDDISIEFERGRFTAIMGPSGSGKSTLLHCIAGLDSLTSGAAFIGDADLSRLNDRQLTVLRRDRIGFIFQSFNLVPTLTAIENIRLPLLLAGRKGDTAWIDKVVDTVHLRDRLRHRPTELSGGQQQRAAVARAMVSRPEIIFADEPTGKLDSVSGAEVLAFFRVSFEEFGQTFVMVTHDEGVGRRCDRLVRMSDGLIISQEVL
jgi:putative ABC transport system ATP-binding protein